MAGKRVIAVFSGGVLVGAGLVMLIDRLRVDEMVERSDDATPARETPHRDREPAPPEVQRPDRGADVEDSAGSADRAESPSPAAPPAAEEEDDQARYSRLMLNWDEWIGTLNDPSVSVDEYREYFGAVYADLRRERTVKELREMHWLFFDGYRHWRVLGKESAPKADIDRAYVNMHRGIEHLLDPAEWKVISRGIQQE
ncbi:MAG TPA: hypothetical protein VFS92_11570 [Planctomycetota bacterium]|nr:hypothetical protein [Planctomycetota bacterium]